MDQHSRAPLKPEPVSHAERAEAGENPSAGSFNIVVSIPETMEIRMVDASVLSDYEIWGLFCSILSSAFVGFLVAYCSATDSTRTSSLLPGAIVTGALFVASLGMTLSKRRRLTKERKEIPFRPGL